MADHLPECIQAEPTASRWPGECICDLLRACEQRVREDERTSDYTGISAAMHTERMRENYERGLGAARDAVADLTPFAFAYQTWISGDYGYDEGPWVKKENALAAIDALKENK